MQTCLSFPALSVIILCSFCKTVRVLDLDQDEEAKHPDQYVENSENQESRWRSFEPHNIDNSVPQFRYTDGSESSSIPLPLILWWTPSLFPRVETEDSKPMMISCGNVHCLTSTNRTLLHDPMTRGLMFYGTELSPFDLPLPRQPWHEWALLHEESPFNNYMLSHYTFIKLFNHTATFRRESDYPLTLQYLYSREYLDRKPVPLQTKNELRQSPSSYAPVLYVQSHCGVASDRDRYVEELMKHIAVDSYGSCLHNRDLPESLTNPVESFQKEEFLQYIAHYKFHIAFENAICRDYMTEKLFRCIHVGSVPIYMGSPNAEDWMPNNKSVIMAQDFASPKELAEYIDFLDKNDDKYLEYLEFKEKGGVNNEMLIKHLEQREWEVNSDDSNDFIIGFECHVCKKLNERLAAEVAHLHNESIPLLPPKYANNSHLGCPQPYTLIGEPENVSPDDRWHQMDWIGQFWGDLDKAYAVRDMLQAKETDPSTFQRYWTDFVERKNREKH